MGLTKEYLRYVPAGNFNIIASTHCNTEFVCLEGQEGRFVAVGACEHIIIWDLKLGEKAQVLPGEKAVVSSICASPDKRRLAAGYSDGNVQIYDLKSAEVVCIFSGHNSWVTSLAYDSFGQKLASGAREIIVWDTVAEVGICRLSGHENIVTQLAFMTQYPILISGSKDGTVKFWDLDTEHCFKTLVGHRSEIWGLVLLKDDRYLVTGCSDTDLRVWKLVYKDPDDENKTPIERLATSLQLAALEDVDDPTHPLQCHQAGTLLRNGKGRVMSMRCDASGQVLGCHGTDRQLELFYFCSDDEALTRLKKRLKKKRKKERKEEDMEVDEATEKDSSHDDVRLSLRDEVKRLMPVNLTAKPKSLCLVLGNGGELRIATSLKDNTLELHTLQTSIKDCKSTCLRTIKSQGHRSEIRAVAFSSDNLVVVTGSADAVKMWNRATQACIQTVATGYILSIVFAPGDRYVLAGQMDGKLLIIDMPSGNIVEEIAAHTEELWSLCLFSDSKGCVSGSSDKTVKFWQFELIVNETTGNKSKVLSLLHTRTLKLDEKVDCVRLSPNGVYVAVALLDATVKIFFVDTFKLWQSLYGHKMPVTCMDISSDSTLIVTGSGDKTVKIWGMKFGDCHRSLFAHDDAVAGLRFVPKTPYFFSCGRDGKVKEWDAKKFNKIITMQGHVGEAKDIAVSPSGQFVVSCGTDNVLRLYERSDQILNLQDEEEEEREQEDAMERAAEKTTVPSQPGLNLPSRKTIGSEKGAESILECLEIGEAYREQLAEHRMAQAASSKEIPLPAPPPLMMALNVTTPDDYLLETIRRIRPSDLEESLLILPFSTVCDILQILPNLLPIGDNCELVLKVSMFLLKLHHGPIVANHTLLHTLEKLHKLGASKANELRDIAGYNLYAMKFMERQMVEAEGTQIYREALVERKKGEKKRKHREKQKRAMIVLQS